MNRTLKQNNYYHGKVIPLVRHGLYDIGYNLSPLQTHEELKKRFLKVEIINESTWEYETKEGSTKELTTKEFIQFIAEVQQWAAEYLNIFIPDPIKNRTGPNQFTNELNELK